MVGAPRITTASLRRNQGLRGKPKQPSRVAPPATQSRTRRVTIRRLPLRSLRLCGAALRLFPDPTHSPPITYTTSPPQIPCILAGAEADLKKSIDWGEAQSPRDERSLAVYYASRAIIRQTRGDLAGAEADIKKSIDWGEAQSPPNQWELAIWYASRASIRRDVAIKGRAAGDAAAATAGFKAARADIDAALTWWLANLPSDERALAMLRETKASIDAAKGM